MNKLKSMTNIPKLFPVYTFSFWKRYWIHMRPYLLYISGIAGLTGMAFVENPNLLHVIMAAIPCFLGYGLGQALTDVFQTDTDSISSSYRPLVKGEISKQAVFCISVLGLLLTPLPMLLWTNPMTIVPLFMCVIGLILYTPFKRRWWGGPFWNSWIVALLPVIGYMALKPDFRFSVLPEQENFLSLLFAILSIFFAYANFVVGGYFKDISADRATGYQTVQVRFGWKAGAVYSDIVALLAFIFAFWAIAPKVSFNTLAGSLSLIILAVTGIINLRAQIQLHQTREESKTHGPIASIVRSFILYSSVIILAYQPQWLFFLIVYYGLFEMTLYLRPEQSQV